jgi:subtilisin family serine protease
MKIKAFLFILLGFMMRQAAAQVAPLDSNRLVICYPAGILPERLAVFRALQQTYGVIMDDSLPRLRMQRWKFISDALRDSFIRKVWGRAAAIAERGTVLLPSEKKKPHSRISSDSLSLIRSAQYWSHTFLNSCPNQAGRTPIQVSVIDCGMSSTTQDSLLIRYCDLGRSRNFTSEPNWNDTETNLHGTRVASVITQVYQRLGMPAQSKILIFKAFNQNGEADLWNILRAIDACILQQVQIVNLSFNYQADLQVDGGIVRAKLVLEEAINTAKNYNILFVTAAGNDGENVDSIPTKGYFSTNFECENLLKVTSDSTGIPTSFGNYGMKSVDIAAPGIVKAVGYNDSLVVSVGTSFAAPVVTALLAIEGSKMRQFDWRWVKAAILRRTQMRPAWTTKLKSTGGVLKPICN